MHARRRVKGWRVACRVSRFQWCHVDLLSLRQLALHACVCMPVRLCFRQLAISAPVNNASYSGFVTVRWYVFGAPTTHFHITVDGRTVADLVNPSDNAYDLNITALSLGSHVVSVVAVDASTVFPLSTVEFDRRLTTPVNPSASVQFTVGANQSAEGTVQSSPVGFLLQPPEYQYGPSIIFDAGNYHMFYCSPGANGEWDFIRMSSSADGHSWSTPVVALVSRQPPTACRLWCSLLCTLHSCNKTPAL